MAKQTDLKVYFFNDLDNANLFEDTFNSFSYGDALITIVGRGTILAELATKDDVDPLINEIKNLEGKDVLIAF